MKAATKTLLKNDVRGILRDPMSFFIALLPLLLALLFRWLIPWGTALLSPYADLSGLESLWLGLLLILTPLMFGWTGGLLLLDERDQGLLPALSVIPPRPGPRLAVKSIVPAALCLPGTFLIIALSGMAPVYNHRYWPIALLAAMQAPLMTLLLSSLATTKVQGFTIAKALTLFYIPPVAVPFFSHPLIHLTALSPPYWLLGAFRAVVNGTEGFWFYLLGGLVYHILLGGILFRLARQRAFRM